MIGEHHTPDAPPDADGRRDPKAKPDWSQPGERRPRLPRPSTVTTMEHGGAPGPAGGVHAVSQRSPGRRDGPGAADSAVALGLEHRTPGTMSWCCRGREHGYSGARAFAIRASVQGPRYRRLLANRARALELLALAAQADGAFRVPRERVAAPLQRKDFSRVPQGLTIALLPPEWNWMERKARTSIC